MNNTRYKHLAVTGPLAESRSNDDQFVIEKEDVVKAIKHMKLKKAPGHDGITPEALKAGGEPTVNTLHKLFIKVLSTIEVPSEWSR